MPQRTPIARRADTTPAEDRPAADPRHRPDADRHAVLSREVRPRERRVANRGGLDVRGLRPDVLDRRLGGVCKAELPGPRAANTRHLGTRPAAAAGGTDATACVSRTEQPLRAPWAASNRLRVVGGRDIRPPSLTGVFHVERASVESPRRRLFSLVKVRLRSRFAAPATVSFCGPSLPGDLTAAAPERYPAGLSHTRSLSRSDGPLPAPERPDFWLRSVWRTLTGH